MAERAFTMSGRPFVCPTCNRTLTAGDVMRANPLVRCKKHCGREHYVVRMPGRGTDFSVLIMALSAAEATRVRAEQLKDAAGLDALGIYDEEFDAAVARRSAWMHRDLNLVFSKITRSVKPNHLVDT